jgi:hypothetical protein
MPSQTPSPVVRALIVFVAGVLLQVPLAPSADAQFSKPSYVSDKWFQSALPPWIETGEYPFGLAFDGTSYWAAASAWTVQYGAAGGFVGKYPGGSLGIFTSASGEVIVGAQNALYRMTALGVFTPYVDLQIQSSDEFPWPAVATRDLRVPEYIAMNAGVVSRWNLSGSFLDRVPLIGYGTLSSTEADEFFGRRIVAAGAYWLTYDMYTVSMWDPTTGQRLGTAKLAGLDTFFDTGHPTSFSYAADGRFWVTDKYGSAWYGYDLEIAAVPEPGTLILVGSGVLVAGALARRRRRV